MAEEYLTCRRMRLMLSMPASNRNVLSRKMRDVACAATAVAAAAAVASFLGPPLPPPPSSPPESHRVRVRERVVELEGVTPPSKA